jgi:hypothetical protein
MILYIIAIVSILAGVYFTVFGCRLLFQKGFYENRGKEINPNDKQLPLKRDSWYFYGRYATGTRSLLTGLVLIGFAFAIASLLHK